jgi:hypothetical protein
MSLIWSLPATVFVSRPFLRLMAASASRIAPDTHQDQASAQVRPAPWRPGRPRRTLVPSRIQKSFTEPWLPVGRRQSPDGLRCGRSAVTTAGDGDPASNSVRLVAAPVTVRGSPDRRRLSGKAARYVERLALLQDVIAGARQLVCQRQIEPMCRLASSCRNISLNQLRIWSWSGRGMRSSRTELVSCS